MTLGLRLIATTLLVSPVACKSQGPSSGEHADLPVLTAGDEIKDVEISWGHAPDTHCPLGLLLVTIHAKTRFFIGGMPSALTAGPVQAFPLWGRDGRNETWGFAERPLNHSVLERGAGGWTAEIGLKQQIFYDGIRDGGCALAANLQEQLGK
jgi:hypothetical protein